MFARNLIYIAAIFLFVGCSSASSTVESDDPSPEDTTAQDGLTDIDPSTQVMSLDDEQAQQVCSHMNARLEGLLQDEVVMRSNCLTMSAMSAGLGNDAPEQQVEACENGFDQCMVEELERAEEGAMDADCLPEQERQNCQATLEELDSCLYDLIEQVRGEAATTAEYSCHELIVEGRLEDVMESVAPEDPESCRIVEAKCPHF